jgi:hypothetical protein
MSSLFFQDPYRIYAHAIHRHWAQGFEAIGSAPKEAGIIALESFALAKVKIIHEIIVMYIE